MPNGSLCLPSHACPVADSNVIRSTKKPQARQTRKWSADEHERYLTALELYPNRSWKLVAEFVRTRTARQVISHAQKIAQKKQRHRRGLKRPGRPRRVVPESPSSIDDMEATSSSEYQDICEWGLGDAIGNEPKHAEDSLLKLDEAYAVANNDRPQWSKEDCEWLAELMRLNGW